MLAIFCFAIVLPFSFSAPEEQIVDGSPAANCQYPSIVHLIFETADGGFACGGTLLDNQHVLTAAHCFNPGTRSISVNIGTNNNKQRGRYVMTSRTWKVHSQYSSRPMLPFGNCVAAAALPSPGEKFDRRCVAAGWGQTGFTSPSSSRLLHVAMPVVDHSVCKKRMSYASLTDQHICGGDFNYGGASTCMGDSGGPFYCPSRNGNMVAAGITSFGYDCAIDAAIFTSVSYFRNWIDNALRTL